MKRAFVVALALSALLLPGPVGGQSQADDLRKVRIRTASSPDSTCLISVPPPGSEKTISVTSFYDETIFPAQEHKLLEGNIGDKLNDVDVDCVAKYFSIREIEYWADNGDPIAIYSLILLISPEDCQGAERKIAKLRILGKVLPARRVVELGFRYKYRIREAPFVAGEFALRCLNDRNRGIAYMSESLMAGYELAEGSIMFHIAGER
ncbi:MAG: hypothetical protein Q7T19_03755 [Caulobacter sp.]|nr:hypothetical protein [Caulobacter sp.]